MRIRIGSERGQQIRRNSVAIVAFVVVLWRMHRSIVFFGRRQRNGRGRCKPTSIVAIAVVFTMTHVDVGVKEIGVSGIHAIVDGLGLDVVLRLIVKRFIQDIAIPGGLPSRRSEIMDIGGFSLGRFQGSVVVYVFLVFQSINVKRQTLERRFFDRGRRDIQRIDDITLGDGLFDIAINTDVLGEFLFSGWFQHIHQGRNHGANRASETTSD